MKTFGTVPELVIALRARTETQLRLVGLDGFEGSGKTTLGFALAAALDCPRFSSDCFIDTDSPHENYIGQLRLDQLERELRLALASFPVVVVDGVCLLEVLQAIGVQAGTHVYVKAVSEQGNWHKGFDIEDVEADPSSHGHEPWLVQQVLRYHISRRPHDLADVCFSRVTV